MDLVAASTGARIAEPDEAISADELQLATRNHGLPLEAMHHDVTPPGLHYVLTHYDIPNVDVDQWRLSIAGSVQRPFELDFDALTAMPSHTVRVTMECAGNGRARLEPRPISQPWLVEAVGTADWTGVPLAALLDDAGVTDDALEVVFTGADHGIERGVEQDYQRALSIADAYAEDVLIAYQMNSQPIPPQHGNPVRLIVPGWYGMAHVKWLRSIEVISSGFEGFQNAVAYRVRQEPGELGKPLNRIEPRALLIPPGFPDFMSRTRCVSTGTVELSGRAWSGWGAVDRVEVSTDDGATWIEASLEGGTSRWSWQRFTLTWQADPGEHVLLARAFDGAGHEQPVTAAWNRGGFANNSAQRVRVIAVEQG
jgi:DMSO/TMAO reductase YedYZ molybdopterin-dependent catalytic subunit